MVWLLFLLLGIVMAVFQLAWQLPRHWDGRSRSREERVAATLPYSNEFNAGLKRTMPATILASPFFIFTSLGLFLSELGGNEYSNPYAIIAVGIGMSATVVFIPVAYFVIYRNRPKWLVAPHYRQELGVVQLRRQEGRLGKSRRRALLEACIWIVVASVGFWLLMLAAR